jgi:IS30 family transposase
MEKNLKPKLKPWTKQDKETLRALIEARTPKAEISKILGRGEGAVRGAAARFKISAKYPVNGWLPGDMEQLVDLVAKNVPIEDIATKLNRTIPATRQKMLSSGIYYQKRRSIRRWTKEEIEELKTLCSQGVSVPQIAKILSRNDCSIYSKCKSLKIEYPKCYEVDERKPKPKQPTLRERLYGK